MVKESYGTCVKCSKEDILGDGLCISCWDGRVDVTQAIQQGDTQQGLLIDQLLGFDKVAKVGRDKPTLKEDTGEIQQAIGEMLSFLTNRQRRVIVLRFGLGGEGRCNLEKIGREFNVSREWIRQIEAKALRRLQWQVYCGRFREFKTYFGGEWATTPGEKLVRAILSVRRKHS